MCACVRACVYVCCAVLGGVFLHCHVLYVMCNVVFRTLECNVQRNLVHVVTSGRCVDVFVLVRRCWFIFGNIRCDIEADSTPHIKTRDGGGDQGRGSCETSRKLDSLVLGTFCLKGKLQCAPALIAAGEEEESKEAAGFLHSRGVQHLTCRMRAGSARGRRSITSCACGPTVDGSMIATPRKGRWIQHG